MKNTNKKRIAIICHLDGFANAIYPLKIKKHFEKQGHVVELVNTIYISKFRNRNNNIPNTVPSYKGLIFTLILLAGLSHIIQKYILKGKKNYFLFLSTMKIRALILKKFFKNKKFDVILCESQSDSFFLLNKMPEIKIYHCATPYADELYFGGQLQKKDYLKFKSSEIEIYKSVNYLAFHWESYSEYVKKHYFYKNNNILKCNMGAEVRKKVVKFKNPPKVIYLGGLGGYWINLPLLSRLSKIYRNIDVYGLPAPDKKYGLNYKGYANPDILSKYQFGLITITKDRLRKEGFSAKHIEYLSYGLPVLVPDWRKDLLMHDASIYYNEENFLDVIKKYSQKKAWDEISAKAYKKAKEMRWENVLKPLEEIINKV